MSTIINIFVQIIATVIVLAIVALLVQWVLSKYGSYDLDYWTTFIILLTAGMITFVINYIASVL